MKGKIHTLSVHMRARDGRNVVMCLMIVKRSAWSVGCLVIFEMKSVPKQSHSDSVEYSAENAALSYPLEENLTTNLKNLINRPWLR